MGVLSAFYTQDIDLTTAHTNLEITVGDFAWVQFWCDGAPHGITVAIETQAGDKAYLNRFMAVPVRAGSKVYVTNDVRSGRSKLQLIFSHSAPLHPYLGGEGISREEVAARIKGIAPWDRRGEVVFADDFESGLAWASGASVGTGFAQLSSAQARSGVASCKLVTTSGATDDAYIYRERPYTSLVAVGLEASFSLQTASKVRLQIGLYTGALFTRGILNVDQANDVLEFMNSGGTFTTVQATLSPYVTNQIAHTMKLVVDFGTGFFKRCIFDDTEYDLKAYPLYSAADAAYKHMYVAITAIGAAKSIYVDDAILTQNEP